MASHPKYADESRYQFKFAEVINCKSQDGHEVYLKETGSAGKMIVEASSGLATGSALDALVQFAEYCQEQEIWSHE